MTKLPIYFLFLFVLVVGVLAVNPHTTQSSKDGNIQIENSKASYWLANNGNILFNFHVFSTIGYNVVAPNINCSVLIYNTTDQLVLSELATMTGIDYSVTLTDNITTKEGEYPYIIICSNSTDAGFISDYFEIANGSPAETNIGGSPLTVIILIPLLFGILLIGASFIFGEDHAILKIFLFLLAYVMIFASFLFGINVLAQYYHFVTLINTITTIIYVLGSMFFVILVYILIHAFITASRIAAQEREQRKEY